MFLSGSIRNSTLALWGSLEGAAGGAVQINGCWAPPDLPAVGTDSGPHVPAAEQAHGREAAQDAAL